MDTGIKARIEKTFLSLPREERETIIASLEETVKWTQVA